MRLHAFAGLLLSGVITWAGPVVRGDDADLWQLALREAGVHRFSTLFTAQDVRQHLGADAEIDRAMDWCRRTAVTKVYVEVFRDGYQAERATLEHARERFRQAGFEVAGCVTTTGLRKKSNGWNEIACYTDPATQEQLQSIFEYAAGLFDEVMIDDFWFTDCTCPACTTARLAHTVTVGTRTFSVPGDSWEDYRGELMLRLSQDRILSPAKHINPRVRIIIKYPQWYDRFHDRGYDVLRETAAFDRLWVGTEVRDYADAHWGGTVPYEGYFIMRWLGGIGGAKCGGGWFDWLGTTERTYVEQARQTILAGARESFLFCYGGLQGATGPKDVVALRADIPELFAVARAVANHPVAGVAAYKPANSHPEEEPRVFDFVGMLGVPLVPGHEFPTNAPAAFFSIHALKDPAFAIKLAAFIARGRPVLVTDGLVARLAGRVNLDRPNVRVLAVKGDPKSLLDLGQAAVDDLRGFLLRPWKLTVKAPNRVGWYWFRDGSWVVENFNDAPVAVELNGRRFSVPARGWRYQWHRARGAHGFSNLEAGTVNANN